ncbi:hypothetical protein TIFTF001_017397 [Ficus carica]|uniref:Uncharacterized protein n=1 Tax=Ficus carica TaxID=3494 RepID=A0AA88AUB3_FICCA|nr:hypothetical protein TIFTF001_017397 [Ficus carica]
MVESAAGRDRNGEVGDWTSWAEMRRCGWSAAMVESAAGLKNCGWQQWWN